MATIINLRGTSGSGKSYVVWHLMNEFGVKSVIKKGDKVVGYRLNQDIMIVGRYALNPKTYDPATVDDNVEICFESKRGISGDTKLRIEHAVKALRLKSVRWTDRGVSGSYIVSDPKLSARKYVGCGGTDQIKSQIEITDRIEKFAKKGKVVVFEGLLVSGLYSRYKEFAGKLAKKGHHFIWAFIDIPIERCIDRAIIRRKSTGNNKMFNGYNTIQKHYAVGLVQQHALGDCFDVRLLNPDRAHKQLVNIVNKCLAESAFNLNQAEVA